MKDFLRDVSAGTLGFIVGNTKGAIQGVKLARLVTKEKEMAPITRSMKRKLSGATGGRPAKRLAATAASARNFAMAKGSGKSRGKGKGKGKKKSKSVLKVGKGKKNSLTSQVQRILQKDQATMTYVKNWVGHLPEPINEGQRFVDAVQMNGGTPTGANFRFFSARKILDAVSIGFNGKTAVLDYTSPLSNFSTPGLRVRVPYASIRLRFRNNSFVSVCGEFYEFKSKKLNNLAMTDRVTQDLSTIVQTGGTTSTILRLGVRPTQLPTIQTEYETVTRKFFLRPGESFTQKLFLKDVIFDFDELTEGSTLNEYVKNVTVECGIRYWVDLSVGKGATTGEIAGHFVNPLFGYGITVECEELYKIIAPPETDDALNKQNWCWFYTPSTLSDVPVYVTQPSYTANPVSV